jgi:hypothetical protein
LRISITIAGLVALANILGANMPEAHPARVILLRHGEKKNATELCSVGQLRAEALSAQYLGKGAPGNDAIFGASKKPDAFFCDNHPYAGNRDPLGADLGSTAHAFPDSAARS